MSETQTTFTESNAMVATAIARTDERPQDNPMAIIQAAIAQGVDADQLEKLMSLQERFERNRAAEAYGAAIAKFQASCPPIYKCRTADAGKMRYQFASFDDVMKVASPFLKECAIALSFSTEANDKGIRVTVRIRVGIHFEDCTLDVPVPQMSVNDTQRYGAALSYAKRYALCAALNIVVTDDIDDDSAGGLDPVNEKQLAQLRELIVGKGVDVERFLKWLGAQSLETIPARDFTKAIDALHRK